MEDMQSKQHQKPDWLVHLEEESWQAELIISGAAIFGCLMLPDALKELEFYILDTINRGSLLLWYGIMVFANMLAYTLIITFILHFSLRALWIGMVGFNSAYPQGFQASESYSKDYQAKIQAEFGDTNGYINRLDRTCSTIFGAGFAVALMALGYILIMVGVGLVLYWLSGYFPKWAQWVFTGVFFGVLVLYSVLNGIMMTKKFREKDWVKRWHFPLNKFFSKFIMNIGYRPASYVMNVLSSHAQNNSKYGLWVVIATSMLIGGLAGSLGSRNLKIWAYIDASYHRLSNDPTAISPGHYADTRCDCSVYRPAIPDYEMYPGELFTVFMPAPNREYFELEEQCDLPEIARVMFDEENRIARLERRIDCARQFYTFYLNGKEVRDYDLSRHWFGESLQFGYLATFPNLPLLAGKNVLKTESNYFNDQGQPRTAIIPFYYFSEKSRPADD